MSHSNSLLSKMISSFFTWSSGNTVSETQDVPIDLEILATIFQGLGYKIRNDADDFLSKEADRLRQVIVTCGKSGQKLIFYKETDYCNCKHKNSNAYWEENLVASGSSLVPPPPSNIVCFIKSFALFLGTVFRRETFHGRLSLPTSSECFLDSKSDNEFPESLTPTRYGSLDGLNGNSLTPEFRPLARSVSQDEDSTIRPRLASDASSVSILSTCSGKTEKEGADEIITNKMKIVGYLEAALKLLIPTKDLTDTKVTLRRSVSNAERAPTLAPTAKSKDPVPEGNRKIILRGTNKYAHVKSTIPKAAIAPRITKKP